MMSTLRTVRALRQVSKASRGLSTVSKPQLAVSANPTTPTLALSLWDRLPFNRSSMPRVPLDVALPDLPAVTAQEIPQEAPKLQISTLKNGLRVATSGALSPVASVSVFIDAGSRYEPSSLTGITHFLELMSLKSTENRTDFRLVREMQKLGINISSSASREAFVYSAESLQEYVPAVVGSLADLIQYPLFHIQELMEEKEIYQENHAEKVEAVDVKIMEAIHEAAYGGQNLGAPLYPAPHDLPAFTAETLSGYVSKFFTADRMVISAVGVNHEQFVKMVEEAFVDLPAASSSSPVEKSAANYTGGEIRMHSRDNSSPAQVALAFETSSWHSKDLVPVCLLQSIMGGGFSFSAGGPGKGMQTRLFTNVLGRYEWVESATCFNSIFSDSGLFGFLGVTSAEKVGSLVDILIKEIHQMQQPVKQVELDRAKAQLKASIHMQLESRAMRAEDIGKQLSTYGQVKSPQELCALIDAVTVEDVQRVAKALTTKPVTVVGHGNLTQLPRYDIIEKQLKQ